MAQMRPPKVPVLSEDAMRRLLSATTGKAFEDRRDEAILRLLYDTGMRRAELTNLTLTDVDLDAGIAEVLGKGRRPRY
jgi:site-specific recombinase XerD